MTEQDADGLANACKVVLELKPLHAESAPEACTLLSANAFACILSPIAFFD